MRKKSIVIIVMILCICSLPLSAYANSATFFDVNNDVSYSIELYNETAKLGGSLSYKATIFNQSEYEIEIVSINDNSGFWFDFWENQIESFILEPGESISFVVVETLSECCDWYWENGKVYIDVKLYIYFRTDRPKVEGWVDPLNHSPAKMEITNLKDGSGLVDLEILGSATEMAYLDEGYNLDYKLNSSKTNINGFAILPIYITNISGQVLEEVLVMNPLLNYSGESLEVNPGQSIFEVEYDYQQIDPTQTRPETSNAYARVQINKNGEYYGVQATAICRNIFIDQKPEMEIEVERLPEALQTVEMGMDSYKVTIKNISKHPIQSFFVDLGSSGYLNTEGAFEETDTIYSFEINQVVTRNFTAPDTGDINIAIGSIVFGEQILSLYYNYNVEEDEGKVWNAYPYMHFDNKSDYIKATQHIVDAIGGDLPLLFENYINEIEKAEASTTPSASPSPSVAQEVQAEKPEPTPTAQIIYVTKNPAIPSWVWPVLGLAIVLVGGVLMWLRQEQNKEEQGEKTDEKSI